MPVSTSVFKTELKKAGFKKWQFAEAMKRSPQWLSLQFRKKQLPDEFMATLRKMQEKEAAR